MPKIKINDQEYDVASLSKECQILIDKLSVTDARITDNRNMQALLLKAKRAYIADIKSEMLAEKAGFDFLSD